MAMLTSRLLQPHEYDRFIAFNKQNSGASVTEHYIKQAVIRIFVRPNDPDRWVASYAINSNRDFRYLSVLLHEKVADLLRQHNINQGDLVEITLLCRDRHSSWTPAEREYYYRMSILDALRTGKRIILGGTIEKKLLGVQMEVLNHPLYAGPMDLFGKPASGWLYYAPRLEVVWNCLVRAVRAFLRTLGKPGAFGRQPGPIKPDILPNN